MTTAHLDADARRAAAAPALDAGPLARGTGLDPPKPGTRSTEFYVMLGLQVVAVVLEVIAGLVDAGMGAGWTQPVLLIGGLILQVGSFLGYNAKRGNTKAKHEEAKGLARIEALKTLRETDMDAEAKAEWFERLAA